MLDTWLQSEPRYKPSAEAAKILCDYVGKKNLGFTVQGLSAAFAQLIKADSRFREIAFVPRLQGEAVKIHDQGGRAPDFAQYPTDDYAFRQEITRMSSNDYWQRYRSDSEFRNRVDELES